MDLEKILENHKKWLNCEGGDGGYIAIPSAPPVVVYERRLAAERRDD